MERVVVTNLIRLQGLLREYCGIEDPNTAMSAALILDNLMKRYPVEDLVTSYPFTEAIQYLTSKGLVEGVPYSITERGWEIYNFMRR